MTEFAWDPETYRQLMAHEVPDYSRLQEQLVTATLQTPAHAVLDLGVGPGSVQYVGAEVPTAPETAPEQGPGLV